MADMKEDPVAYWNEQAGDGWAAAQEPVDRMMAPLTEALLKRAVIQEGERVVDIGCGCGTTTLLFAEQVGDVGRALGVDVSSPMLSEAKRRGTGVSNVDFLLADAQSHEWTEKFDLLTSRFGIMFFEDPEAAFSNLYRGLDSSGRVVAMVWQSPEKNPWISFISKAVVEGDDASSALPVPDDGPGPFRMANEKATRALLERAGFQSVRLESVETTLQFGTTVDEALEGQTKIGPFSRMLRDADSETTRGQLLTKARSFLEKEFEQGPPQLPAAVWIVTARK